jgi:hypothetical protein
MSCSITPATWGWGDANLTVGCKNSLRSAVRPARTDGGRTDVSSGAQIVERWGSDQGCDISQPLDQITKHHMKTSLLKSQTERGRRR